MNEDEMQIELVSGNWLEKGDKWYSYEIQYLIPNPEFIEPKNVPLRRLVVRIPEFVIRRMKRNWGDERGAKLDDSVAQTICDNAVNYLKKLASIGSLPSDFVWEIREDQRLLHGRLFCPGSPLD